MAKYKKNRQPESSQQRTTGATFSTSASTTVSTQPRPQPATKLRTMDQERAEYALKKITGIAQNSDSKRQKEMRSYITSLPALIRTNGLGQALAFCRTKHSKDSTSSHEIIYGLVSTWLCSTESKGQIFTEDTDVLIAITHSDVYAYMAAQNEALALLEWLKKFAVALLEKGED